MYRGRERGVYKEGRGVYTRKGEGKGIGKEGDDE